MLKKPHDFETTTVKIEKFNNMTEKIRWSWTIE